MYAMYPVNSVENKFITMSRLVRTVDGKYAPRLSYINTLLQQKCNYSSLFFNTDV